MNPDTLKAIQKKGWAIETADVGSCTVKCPTPGCKMRARFRHGSSVPQRDVPGYSWDQAVGSFDEARESLKVRRQELGLTIAEVEHISGIAGDHLAKFERTNWMDKNLRMPNVETFMEWATALGFDVVLRHGELPPVTLRWIADTRPKIDARRRRFEIERRKDADLRRPVDPMEAERSKLQRQIEFLQHQLNEVEAKIEGRNQQDLFGGFEE